MYESIKYSGLIMIIINLAKIIPRGEIRGVTKGHKNSTVEGINFKSLLIF